MARAIKGRTSGRNPASRGQRAAARVVGPAWTIRRARGLQVVESTVLGNLGWLAHGFSTRVGGVSRVEGKAALNLGFTEWDTCERVAANRQKFVAVLGAGKMPLVAMRQFHSDVIHLDTAPMAEAPNADALITATPGLLLGVQTADCVPILLADTKRHVVAAVHAGWRGTLARLVAKTLGRMRMEYGL